MPPHNQPGFDAVADDKRPIHIGRKFDGTEVDLSKMCEIADPMRKEFLLGFSAFPGLKNTITRPVDISVVYVMLSCSVTLLGSVAAQAAAERAGLFASSAPWLPHVFGVAHMVLMLLQVQGFILGLHYSAHKCIWKAPYKWVDSWVSWVLCPLLGIPSNCYYAHHIIMHHKEDNAIWYDASSTMPYRRDSYLHMLAYCMRYLLGIWVELPLVMLLRKRWGALASLCGGLGTWFTVLYFGAQLLPRTTLYCWFLPWLVISFALMRGNSIQHVFVSPDDPEDDFRLAYDLVNTKANNYMFNDGFHIEHHLSPVTHWHDLPAKFLSYLPRHRDHDSLIFDGIDGDVVSSCVCGGRLEELADHYIHIGQKSGESKEKLVAEMKRRLAPIYTITSGKMFSKGKASAASAASAQKKAD